MSSDNQQTNSITTNMTAEEYWSGKNIPFRSMEISFDMLSYENKNFKKQIETQKAEILALKKEIRILKGLEPDVIEEEPRIQDNGLVRSYCGQKFDDEEHEEEYQVDSVPIVRQYCCDFDRKIKPQSNFQNLFQTLSPVSNYTPPLRNDTPSPTQNSFDYYC